MANLTKNHKKYSVIELFAGAGGMALGFEKAGFETLLLNEIDRTAAKTLNHNRPKWNVINADIKTIDFSKYHNQADVVTGGFPCQAFTMPARGWVLMMPGGLCFMSLLGWLKKLVLK